MPKKQKQNELRSKIEEEFKKSCGEELGFVSAIFMSQGKIKAKDIVMPTTELEESVDRFGLYLFEAMEKLEDLYKQEIKGILNLDIFANKYSSRFVNKGILMAYDAIKEHIEGKKEEPKGEQSKCLTRFKNGGSVVLLKKAGKDKFKGIRKYNK